MKRFEQISKGDLKKYDGCKCKCENKKGIVCEGEIYVEDNWIFILHNNPEANGQTADNLKGYKYSRKIYQDYINDEAINNDCYEWIEIETKLKHNEVEVDGVVYRKVYVSDLSVEDALVLKAERILLAILPGNKTSKYLTTGAYEGNKFITGTDYYTSQWKYIAEIEEPKEEVIEELKEVTLKLTPEQLEQIKKQFNI